MAGEVASRSWENVTHAEQLWKEAESKSQVLEVERIRDQRGLGGLYLRKALG